MTCSPQSYPVGVEQCLAQPVYICNADEIGGTGGAVPPTAAGAFIALAPVCAEIDGVPMKITPVVYMTPGAGAGEPQYLDALGFPVSGANAILVNDCRCDLPPDACPAVIGVTLACYDTGSGSVAVTGTKTVVSGSVVSCAFEVVESTDPAYAIGDSITDVSLFTAIGCDCKAC